MYYKSGELIKMLRMQRGFSQNRLAEGIIDRSNLSKAERGKHELTKEKMDALLDRLGYSARRLISYALNNEEYRIFTLRDELDACLAHWNFERAEKLMAELEKMPAFQEDLLKQYLLKSKVILHLMKQDKDIHYALKLLTAAIRITIPAFDEKCPRFSLLTCQDIEIINQLANIHYQNAEIDKAICLLEKAAVSIRKHTLDEYEKTCLLALVLFNLSNILVEKPLFAYALEICNEAIDSCRNNRVYGMLPNFIFNKAHCLFYFGRIKEVKPLLLQAYYGFLIQGQASKAVIMQEYAKINFQINIIQAEI